MLRSANDQIKISHVINRLQHEVIRILGTETGDPIVSDHDFQRLNQLGIEISVLKNELKAKTLKSEMIKKAYYKAVSRIHGCRIRLNK